MNVYERWRIVNVVGPAGLEPATRGVSATPADDSRVRVTLRIAVCPRLPSKVTFSRSSEVSYCKS